MSYGMFRLPLWSSVVGGNKVTSEDVEVLAAPQRTASTMESTTSHNLKRKRSDSGEFDKAISTSSGNGNMEVPNSHSQPPAGNGHVSAKTHVNTSLYASSSAASSTQATSLEGRSSNPPLSTSKDQESHLSSNNDPLNNEMEKEPILQPKASRKMMDPNTLRETVEAQLSLEILLKHDELRLIDQEIAKCQVALEQLRRCHEIPYPVSNQTGPSLSVASGTGFSIAPRDGSRAPSSPAPWGVSDGPYSRHYSAWLLSDSRFDGGEPEMAPQRTAGAGKTVAEGRKTRASWNEAGGAASRSQRGSKGAKLQELPNGNPAPKDKGAPVIIKRKSDGLYVKLVCIDCRRVNFSSTQGFINHCRIAHHRVFATHEAAAQASGEPVEVDETGAVIGNGDESSSSGPSGHVHPLIRAAHVVGSKEKMLTSPRKKSASSSFPGPTTKPENTDKSTTKQPPTPSELPLGRPDGVETNPSFKASPQTPHLSALMQRKGLGLDLHNIVDDALSKTDIDVYSSGEESEDETEQDLKNEKSPPDPRGRRVPARTVVSSSTQRPGSQKGADKGGRKPRSSTTSKPPSTPGRLLVSLPLPQTSPESTHQTQLRDHDGDMNLSPHTVESNQAPSLVSDDGECGARTSESPGPSSSVLSEDETMFDNIEVQDDGNESTTTGSAPDVGVTPTPGKHRPAAMSRAASTAKSGKAKGTARESTTTSPVARKGNTKKQRRK